MRIIKPSVEIIDQSSGLPTGAPHPDIKIIAEPLMKEFISRGLIVK